MIRTMADVAEKLKDMGVQKGLKKGRKQGINQGRREMVYEFVHDGTITTQQGADELGISVEELEEQMKESDCTCR